MNTRAKSLSRIESAMARRELLSRAFSGELRWSEAILQMRLSLGKTQEEFGRMFGISRRKVIDLEAGRANPELRTLTRIGKPFGLTVGFVPSQARMHGKFELYKDKAGEYRFRLKSSNGEVLLASEGYQQRESVQNGIEFIQKNALDDTRYERKETKPGKYIFNLKANNGQVVGTSESYNSVTARDSGIASVKKNARGAKITDLTNT